MYVDAFAGAGVHELKATGELVPGSPLNALAVEPPFKEVHLIDLDQSRVQHLKELIGDRRDVFAHEGDCNTVLVQEVFPRIRYEDYRRGLCLLDPYGLSLRWEVIVAAAKMRSIEIFLNFPMMDMNRNALWTNPSGISAEDLERMTAFWGDESWRATVYRGQLTLDGGEDLAQGCDQPRGRGSIPEATARGGWLQGSARADPHAKQQECDSVLLVLRLAECHRREDSAANHEEVCEPRRIVRSTGALANRVAGGV